MSPPKERLKVHLFLIGSMMLFAGVLALPLLIEEDVVRVGFGGEGLHTQGGGEDAVLQVDKQIGLRPPGALLTTPQSSGTVQFRVAWDGDGPDPTGHYAFDVQYGPVSADAEDEIVWQDWFQMRRSHLPREAVFTGTPDATYQFRARTCDLLLDCGRWSDPATTRVLPDAVPSDVRLSLDPHEPTADQTVMGRVAIGWDYHHDGPGDPVVSVTLDTPDAATGTPLYSGPGRSVVWDTTAHADGTYHITLRLRDGVHHTDATVPVRVANEPPSRVEMSAPAAAGPDDGDGADEGRGSDVAESVAVPWYVVLAGMVLAACGRRR